MDAVPTNSSAFKSRQASKMSIMSILLPNSLPTVITSRYSPCYPTRVRLMVVKTYLSLPFSSKELSLLTLSPKLAITYSITLQSCFQLKVSPSYTPTTF